MLRVQSMVRYASLALITLVSTACGGSGTDTVFEQTPGQAPILADLQLAHGFLTPAFDPAVAAYDAGPELFDSTTTLIAETDDPNAVLRIHGNETPNGIPSAPIALFGGTNEVLVEVIRDGMTTTYTVTFDRSFHVQSGDLVLDASPQKGAFFASDVSVDGNTMAVAATGFVVLHERVNDAWVEHTRILQPAGANKFGGFCELQGDRLLVGGTPGAYLFERQPDGRWLQDAVLIPQDSTPADTSAFWRISMDGDTVVLGARLEDSDGSSSADNSLSNAGAAHVFVRGPGGWTQQAYLKSDVPGAGDLFGTWVSIDGDICVVGASSESGNGSAQGDRSLSRSGAVYVFERSASVWTQTAYLKADIPGVDAQFGSEILLENETLVVTAIGERGDGSSPADDSLTNAGAVYVFERSASGWTQQAYLKPPAPVSSGYFGSPLALHNDLVLVFGRTQQFVHQIHAFVRTGSTWTNAGILHAPQGSRHWSNAMHLTDDELFVSDARAVNNGLDDAGAVHSYRR